jgi:hypothetical protein
VVAAAEGDAVLVGEGDDVVRVRVFQREADQAAAFAFGSEDADAREFAEGGVGFFGEAVVMGGDFLAAERIQIIHRGVEADGVGDVGRAGFEALRRGFPFAA